MSCYLCGENSFTKRPGIVRDNKNLDVLECSSCGLVFLSSFSHINDAYYEDSGMHEVGVDVEVWRNQTAQDDERRFLFLQRMLENRSVLDFGCGNGGFLKRARSIARNAMGVELEKRLQPYFLREGLKVFQKHEEITDSFDVISLFHVLEHIPDPIELLKALSEKLSADGQIVIEVPNANDALLCLYQSKAFSHFTYWGCHLFLFTNSTIGQLVRKAGLKVNYIKQVQRYPLSNHLYWLAKEKPGGHREWAFLDSMELRSAYENSLASIGACDTILASISK